MSVSRWIKDFDSGDIPVEGIDLLRWFTNPAVRQAPASWIQLFGGIGATATIKDGAGNVVELTVAGSISVWQTEIHALLACSDSVLLGTGEAPGVEGTGSLPPVETVANLPPTTVDGSVVFVKSKYALYVYGSEGWVRARITDAVYATKTDIYVSEATGDDENDGLSVDTPLATLDEVFSRVGDNSIRPSSGTEMRIHIMDSLSATDVDIDIRMPKDGEHFLTIYGVPTIALTTTIAAVTPWDAVNGAGVVGTVQGALSLVPHVGKVCRVVGGDRDGAHFVLDGVESGTNIRFASSAYGLWSIGPNGPEVGDTIEVLDLPSGPSNWSIRGDAVVFIAYLHIAGSVHSFNCEAGSQVYLSGCVLEGGAEAAPGALLSLIACNVDNGVRAQGAAYAEAWHCVVDGVTCRTQGEAVIGDVIFKERLISNFRGAVTIVEGCFAWFEAAAIGPFVDLAEDSSLLCKGTISGRGVLAGSSRLRLKNGAKIYYASGDKPSIAGAGQELVIGGENKDYADLPYSNASNGASVVVIT